jgi:DNA-binding ferritin-like protein (Dps family)
METYMRAEGRRMVRVERRTLCGACKQEVLPTEYEQHIRTCKNHPLHSAIVEIVDLRRILTDAVDCLEERKAGRTNFLREMLVTISAKAILGRKRR